MTVRLAALALIALPFAVPGLAAAPSHSSADHADHAAAPENPAQAAPEMRKVCRNETATGSNMPRRVCRMVAQTSASERSAERTRERQNRMGSSAD